MVRDSARTTAVLEGYSQRIVIEPDVLAHMARNRQRSWFSREAGGQLFGSFTKDEVLVSVATGPYRGDQRSRCSYRSNPRAAQKMIDTLASQGLAYLGEWHTHPEMRPVASSSDHRTISLLHARSAIQVSSVIMLIQGTSDGLSGLALYSISADAAIKWTIFEGLSS